MRERTRLGIDIGTNSIGWCLYALGESGTLAQLIDAGVRIFSDGRDPESGDPLGTARREARQPRRQRDRRITRKRLVMNELVRLGLMPADPAARKALEGLDPIALRARGVDAALEPFELGRAIFHLTQRRGFRSNRLAGPKKDEKTGKVVESINELRVEMQAWGSVTLGQHLHRRIERGLRARGQFWTDRTMHEEELGTLLTRQVALRPELGPIGRFDRLRGLIFHQRPLREQPVGWCTIEGPPRTRAPWALPVVQQFRILQELANLRVSVPPDPTPRPLDRVQRDRLLQELSTRSSELRFERMRSLLGLPDDARFNLESERRKGLKNDATAGALAHRDLFGRGWHTRPIEERNRIVRFLIETEEPAAVETFGRELGLSAEAAAKLAKVRLPQGHTHVGLPVVEAVVPIMREQGLGFAHAVAEAELHHSDFRPDRLMDRLPYYGEVLARYCQPVRGESAAAVEQRYGRIANPTVHRGLNELRKVVNTLIARYGRPDQIHVELARELKLGRDRNAEIDAENTKNRRLNDDGDKQLVCCGMDPSTMGKGELGEYRRRYRLWLELDEQPQRRCCPYTGRPIGIRALFSSEVEIEHVLPFSRTLDDSMANKTVAYRDGNRDKGEHTPFEAFGSSPTIGGRRYDWEAIAERASRLPKNKAWRFGADAMARFEGEGGFVARQLADTTYLARVTRLYLQHVCRPDDVVALPGRLTALLRGKWGLNDILAQGNWKNREDHRHHAIDAAVVAATDRATLQRVSRTDEKGRERITVPTPYEAFRAELEARLRTAVVSHKPEHGIAGKLHDETAFGPTPLENEKGTPLRVVRRKREWFDKPAKLAAIRDLWLRAALQRYVDSESQQGRSLKEALASFRDPAGKPLRHIRCLEPMLDGAVVPVRDGNGRIYKLYAGGGNAFMDIWRLPDGRWTHRTVSMFEANQRRLPDGSVPKVRPQGPDNHPAAKHMMRLFKGDAVRLLHRGDEQTMRVQQLWDDRVVLAGPSEGGRLDQRNKAEGDPFEFVRRSVSRFPSLRFRKVGVDPLGRLSDPGFRP